MTIILSVLFNICTISETICWGSKEGEGLISAEDINLTVAEDFSCSRILFALGICHPCLLGYQDLQRNNTALHSHIMLIFPYGGVLTDDGLALEDIR